MLTPILIVVCLISVTSGHPHERRQNDEPICSKFDYEEKLLEKMIRMEMKMEKIIEEVKGINRTMIEEKNRLSDLADKSPIPIVGFNARLSSAITLTSGNKVVFDLVIINKGEGYDSNTGIFTAPHTGLYFFSAHVCNEVRKGVQYAIYQEGSQLTRSTQFDHDNQSCSSVSTIAWVNEAERLWVQTLSGSMFHTHSYRLNAFSGALLNK